MSRQPIAAYTELNVLYPGYVSMTRLNDNSVAITVRSPGGDGSQCAEVVLPAADFDTLVADLTKGKRK